MHDTTTTHDSCISNLKTEKDGPCSAHPKLTRFAALPDRANHTLYRQESLESRLARAADFADTNTDRHGPSRTRAIPTANHVVNGGVSA